jgi:scyllo-inositol 2-dehydrogenase (NADP+)
MKVVVVGLGVQGQKRLASVGREAAGTVDPAVPNADHKRIEEVPLDRYDAALVCTPDEAKLPILTYLAENGKHFLVEKPLLTAHREELDQLQRLLDQKGVVGYTAYNHRFEPHIATLRQVLASGRLGKLYSARFYYGNGTARDARNSPWRDSGAGVLPDLGSHLLDMVLFLFGEVQGPCRVWRADRFENRAFDHFMFGFHGNFPIDCEMSMLSYRNSFSSDVYGEMGSAHISCLCKWGPSTLTLRKRAFPSGRPDEESSTLICGDPTWAVEYDHFRRLCESPSNNLSNDMWIQERLRELMALTR